jgi:hypothetical protein
MIFENDFYHTGDLQAKFVARALDTTLAETSTIHEFLTLYAVQETVSKDPCRVFTPRLGKILSFK